MIDLKQLTTSELEAILTFHGHIQHKDYCYCYEVRAELAQRKAETLKLNRAKGFSKLMEESLQKFHPVACPRCGGNATGWELEVNGGHCLECDKLSTEVARNDYLDFIENAKFETRMAQADL